MFPGDGRAEKCRSFVEQSLSACCWWAPLRAAARRHRPPPPRRLGVTANGEEASLDAQPGSAAAAKPGSSTIVEIVLQADGEFDVLQAAVVKAGLVDLLNGKDQYTVFAPTDLAFVTTLGVADEAAAIAAVEGLPVRSADQHSGLSRHPRTPDQSLGVGGAVLPDAERGTLTRDALSAAGIAATDISASNGIVHVINAVLLP